MRVHLHITGQVQGVFFRTSLKEKADQLNVNGWVKNNSNGEVEAVLEGEEKAVQELIEWCKQGPAAAEVDDVKVVEEEVEGMRGFEIKVTS